MKTYRVNEIFHSLQGEGIHAGEAAIFIRLSGCNLKCPFCDTDFAGSIEMSVQDIISAMGKCLGENPLPRLCVITGGEPTLQLEDTLIDVLHDIGMMVAIETNGTHEVPVGVDWVTVSPKSPFIEGDSARVILKKANEVKVIMTESISTEEIREFEKIPADWYFIQPCDTGFVKLNKYINQRVVKFVKYHPNWRVSLQQQKILKVR